MGFEKWEGEFFLKRVTNKDNLIVVGDIMVIQGGLLYKFCFFGDHEGV